MRCCATRGAGVPTSGVPGLYVVRGSGGVVQLSSPCVRDHSIDYGPPKHRYPTLFCRTRFAARPGACRVGRRHVLTCSALQPTAFAVRKNPTSNSPSTTASNFIPVRSLYTLSGFSPVQTIPTTETQARSNREPKKASWPMREVYQVPKLCAREG
eukprot:1376112-Pyramimonas_sp.AAC.2